MQLGCSIYPDNHSFEEMAAYIDLLHQYGMKRVFISLLQLSSKDQDQLHKYRDIVQYLQSKGMTVVADINPEIIEDFGWQEDLIGQTKAFGIDVLRLDNAPSLDYMVALANNNQGIKVEINLSTNEQVLVDLLEAGASSSQLTASHNFYPRRYTGLSLDHFNYMTNFFRELGIETAAFINSNHAQEGPWPISEGLCSLEMHRNQSIETQAKFYKLLSTIDTVIIANQFVSESELKALNAIVTEDITFKMRPSVDLTSIERAIIEYPHTYRGDISSYVIRSSMTRVVYKDESIKARGQNGQTQMGDILIDNDGYTRYNGELYIGLDPMQLDGRTNHVGAIIAEERYLLDYLKAWQAFKLEIVE